MAAPVTARSAAAKKMEKLTSFSISPVIVGVAGAIVGGLDPFLFFLSEVSCFSN
jgi:hypothetical protein